MNSCEYSMSLKVTLHYLNPPTDHSERMQREVMQSKIDAKVGAWLSDTKNQQNLMNMILGSENTDSTDCVWDFPINQEREITRLRTENEAIQQHHKFAVEQWTLEAQQTKELEEKAHDLRAETDRLSRALAEAERDAARYRWLRNGSAKDISDIELWLYETRDELDAAIDAAMAREEG